MDNTKLQEQLEQIGLSDKEAKVFLASLKLGGTAIQDIASEANVNRSTTHVIMQDFIERGLASSFTKGKKRYFAVEHPNQLKAVIARQEEELAEKRNELEHIIPGLIDLYTSSESRPQVRFLEGKEGVRAMEEDLFERFEKEQDQVGFVPVDDLLNAFPDYSQETGKKRVKKGIKTRVIYTHENGPVEDANSPKLKREARYIPKTKFPFTTEIVVCGNAVYISSYREPIGGVIIESSDIAHSLKSFFELAWEAAEKYNKNAS